LGVVLMRILESTPTWYAGTISLLSLGRLVRPHEWLAPHIQEGMRVLDLGTETGALALLAASQGADVVAIDVKPFGLGQRLEMALMWAAGREDVGRFC